MKNIHIITALSRMHLVDILVEYYSTMNIIWHPVMFSDEAEKFNIDSIEWINPLIINDIREPNISENGYIKKNAFIQKATIAYDDYYCILDDDDMIEHETINKIRFMSDDVIFISLKRGHNIPKDAPDVRRYPVSTLEAHPNNVGIGRISQQQYIVKGSILKKIRFDESRHDADGLVAIWLKENYLVRYENGLYSLFNYFEEGRWNKQETQNNVRR